MAAKIRRNLMLKAIDIKETPDGDQVSFSIIFIKKDGERVFVPRAVSTGLPYSLSSNRLRGILSIDANGNKIGHVYPVCIGNILEYDSLEVIP